MTVEAQRIEALENRVDKIEDTNRNDIATLHTKIDGLVTSINNVLVAAAKAPVCPAPGSCMTLNVTVQELIKAHNATMLRVERLELKLLELQMWRWKFVGALSAVIFIATMFGPILRKAFKLE